MRTRFFTTTIAIVGVVLFVRLFFLQIISDQYGDLSLKNSVLKHYIYPERGYVFDRNGTLLVSNQPMYDLMVIPKNLEPFDTLDLCKMLRLPKSELVERINKARRYSLTCRYDFLNNKFFYASFISIFIVSELYILCPFR